MLAMRPTFNQKVFVVEHTGDLQADVVSAERLRRDVVVYSGQQCSRVDQAYALSAKSFADAGLTLGG